MIKFTTLDIETWGTQEGYALQPWRCRTDEAGIMCIAIASDEDRKVYSAINVDAPHIIFTIKSGLLRSKSLFCGWNLKFDLAFLYAAKLIPDNMLKFLDGMLLLKRMFPNLKTHALKPTLKAFSQYLVTFANTNKLKIDVKDLFSYADDIKFKIKDEYTEDDIKKIEKYCRKDTYYTHILIKYLCSIARPEDINCAIIDSTVSYLFAKATVEGIPLNREFLCKYTLAIDEKLNYLIPDLSYQNLTPIILDSPMQLRNALKEKGIQIDFVTEKGEVSVNKASLKQAVHTTFNPDHKMLLDKILLYKQLNSEKIKFLKFKDAFTDDIVHPEPFLLSTYTGRVTYSIYQTISKTKTFKNGKQVIQQERIPIGVPLHQMKRGIIRNMIAAPEGYDIVEIDFCAQEMRIFACVANEQTMLKLFRTGKDIHAYTAAKICGLSYDEFLTLQTTDVKKYDMYRYIGKITNLALQYRLSDKMLFRHWQTVHNLWNKTLDDAIFAKKTYLEIYPCIHKYWNTAILFAKNNGFARNMAGRRYPLKFNGIDDWTIEQTALNFPIQSTGAEQKMLALFCLRKVLNKFDAKFAWDLHDGMYFFIRKNKDFLHVIQCMKKIVENLPYENAWNWKPQIQFPVEIKSGKTWGTLIQVHSD